MEKTPTRWWDLPSAILLFLMIQVSAWRLQATNWVEQLYLVGNIATIGLLVGMALGQSKFQRRNVIFLSSAYMLVTFTWQWLRFIKFGRDQNYLGEQLLILLSRLLTNLSEYMAGRAVNDSILVLALLSIPYWLVSLYSGYQLTRYAKALACILPSAILMLIVHYYHYTAKDYGWMFGIILFAALLLLGRQKYITDKAQWLKSRVQISGESGVDVITASFTVTFVIMILAWLIPYALPTHVEIREAWRRTSDDWFSGESFENLFSSLNKEENPQARNFQNSLGLGTQISQSEEIAFLVYAPPAAAEYPRLYWRGQVYDLYENGRWFISNSEEGLQNQSVDMEIPDTQNRSRLSFAFDVYMPTQLILYTAGQPISINQNTIVLYKNIPPSETRYDVLTLLASPALKKGDLVRIASMMGNPIISELQTASTEYPSWVLENYLHLPENFSPDIQALALQITQPYNNPFDKATAITNYLRNAIQYSPTVSIPEDVEDPLAYFLFDLKSGFCNYSASAAVLMLRSVGIPARLAVGYAEGESEIQNNVYTVRERDYHAWPEVYFPEYGWVEFEPTGNQEPISRPTERAEQTASLPIPLNPLGQTPNDGEEQLPVNNEALVEEQETPLVSQNQMQWLSLFGGIILLIGLGIFIKRKYAPQQSAASILKVVLEKNKIKVPRWLDTFLIWSSLPSIEKSFHAINTGLRQLDKPQPLDSTPIERANALKKLLPSAQDSIDALLREYQNEMFSKTRGNEQTARRAAFRVLTYAIWARVKFEIMGYN
jgi:transglutaminase-like putative cysteine protease/chromate transport protein ChrA